MRHAHAMMNERVAVVGVGRMGANMARRLKDVGYPVTAVFDVNREVAEALAAELGCAAPACLAEVTAAADVILTVVTDDAAMRAIFTTDSLLKEAAGKTFLNAATLSPAVHEEVTVAARAAG